MNFYRVTSHKMQVPSFTPMHQGALQRKCTCGSVSGPTGECAECRRKRLLKSAPATETELARNQPGTKHQPVADTAVLLPYSTVAEPRSEGSSNVPEEPFGEFNEEAEGTAKESTEIEPAEEALTEIAPMKETETTTATPTTAPAAPTPAPTAPPTAARTVIRGPRELWFFDGETPANYIVSAGLSTNRSGGTLRWSTSPHLTLSSPTDARPRVTTNAPSAARRDAWIRLQHTDASGITTAASYRLTVLAPSSLTHLRNVDNPVAGLGYESELHYSIHDQLGTVLPRNVPINEQWTGAAVADFPGGNWTRPNEGSATVNPADWHDRVTGEGDAGAVPAPVAPTHADAAVAAEHWPGDWRVGSLTIGNGRLVSSVTWQRNRGFARHT